MRGVCDCPCESRVRCVYMHVCACARCMILIYVCMHGSMNLWAVTEVHPLCPLPSAFHCPLPRGPFPSSCFFKQSLPALLKDIGGNRPSQCGPSNICTCFQHVPLALFCHITDYKRFLHTLVKSPFHMFKTSWSTKFSHCFLAKDLSIFLGYHGGFAILTGVVL